MCSANLISTQADLCNTGSIHSVSSIVGIHVHSHFSRGLAEKTSVALAFKASSGKLVDTQTAVGGSVGLPRLRTFVTNRNYSDLSSEKWWIVSRQAWDSSVRPCHVLCGSIPAHCGHIWLLSEDHAG